MDMPSDPLRPICGIGNAIVDVVAPVEDVFLSKQDMHKGAMALITAERAEALVSGMLTGRQGEQRGLGGQ